MASSHPDAGAAGAAGAFDTFLNVQITVVLAVQLVLCLACASASLHWRQAQGFARYHLALTDFHEGAPRSAAGGPAHVPGRGEPDAGTLVPAQSAFQLSHSIQTVSK
jgi:hypothetical protein